MRKDSSDDLQLETAKKQKRENRSIHFRSKDEMKRCYTTPEDAKRRGYWALTNAYFVLEKGTSEGTNERRRLDAAIKQLGDIGYVLVEANGGVEIWRSGRKLDVSEE